MENNVTIVWSFRNRIDVLKKSILSADKTTPKNVNFCLVDAASTDETIKELRDFCNKIDNNTNFDKFCRLKSLQSLPSLSFGYERYASY